MGYEHIRHGGNALRHTLGVLLLAWRHIVRAAGIAMLVGIAITEIVGALVTHHFPPYLLTHVVALSVGIALAYCVGLTVLVDELLKGTLALVRMALGEAEAGARAAAVIAEREVGDVWGWAWRLIVGRDASRPRIAAPNAPAVRAALDVSSPLRPSARTLGQFPMRSGGPAGTRTTGAPEQRQIAPAPSDSGRLRVPPRLGTAPGPVSSAPRDETLDDIVATEVFRRTAPPVPANAHPVRADQLPRIEWAAEGLAAGAALIQSVLAARAHHASQAPDTGTMPTPAAVETPLEPMPPLPRRDPDTAPPAPTSAQAPAVDAAPSVSPTLSVASAPSTTPLEPPAVAPRPTPRPSLPARTIPVVTDDTTRAALDAAQPVQEPQAEAAGDSPAAASGVGGPASGAHWEPPSRVIVLPAGADGTDSGQAANMVAGAAGDEEPPGAEELGLWSRIGQALMRSTTRPLRARGDGDAAD